MSGTSPEEVGPGEIVSLCYSDPDAGLEVIRKVISENPELESNSLLTVAKATAYGSKGLYQTMRQKPELNIHITDAHEIREMLGLTDKQLDCLEIALREIRELEKVDPEMWKKLQSHEPLARLVLRAENKHDGYAIGLITLVDGIVIVLEKCRPGRFQQILGNNFRLQATRLENHVELLSWIGK